MNYIHYNPIKHGHVQCAHSWQWSSFHRLVKENVYEPGWCCGCEEHVVQAPDFTGLDVNGIEAAFGE
jgi:putative transposase